MACTGRPVDVLIEIAVLRFVIWATELHLRNGEGAQIVSLVECVAPIEIVLCADLIGTEVLRYLSR